jgi:hypothetical protein
MKEVNYVFGALEEPDVEALMRIGTQQQLHVSDQFLTEGTHHDALLLLRANATWGSFAFGGTFLLVGKIYVTH